MYIHTYTHTVHAREECTQITTHADSHTRKQTFCSTLASRNKINSKSFRIRMRAWVREKQKNTEKGEIYV